MTGDRAVEVDDDDRAPDPVSTTTTAVATPAAPTSRARPRRSRRRGARPARRSATAGRARIASSGEARAAIAGTAAAVAATVSVAVGSTSECGRRRCREWRRRRCRRLDHRDRDRHRAKLPSGRGPTRRAGARRSGCQPGSRRWPSSCRTRPTSSCRARPGVLCSSMVSEVDAANPPPEMVTAPPAPVWSCRRSASAAADTSASAARLTGSHDCSSPSTDCDVANVLTPNAVVRARRSARPSGVLLRAEPARRRARVRACRPSSGTTVSRQHGVVDVVAGGGDAEDRQRASSSGRRHRTTATRRRLLVRGEERRARSCTAGSLGVGAARDERLDRERGGVVVDVGAGAVADEAPAAVGLLRVTHGRDARGRRRCRTASCWARTV